MTDEAARDGLKAELNAWGRWVESHLYYEGYPTHSAGMRLTVHSGMTPGSRVLCLDMPGRIYATHRQIWRLNEQDREAIYIWYVFRVKKDGTLWDQAEKAGLVGISDVALRQRVTRARLKILGLPLINAELA